MVPADAGDDLASVLGDLHPPDHPRPTDWRSAWLLVWRHPSGHDVEFIGGGVVVVDGVEVELPPSDVVTVDWHGRSVPVSAPAVWDRLAA